MEAFQFIAFVELKGPSKIAFETALNRYNLRSTRQREHVFSVVLGQRDHPTADDIYLRARVSMPGISLATVYNCLDTLVDCQLVKRLVYEREPSRYCPNQGEHAHFLDEEHGTVYDIDLSPTALSALKALLPAGFVATKVKLSFAGRIDRDKIMTGQAASSQTVPPAMATEFTTNQHHS